MKKKKKKHISILIICIIGYLTLDYLNIPTLLNLRTYNINNDFLSIFIDSTAFKPHSKMVETL